MASIWRIPRPGIASTLEHPSLVQLPTSKLWFVHWHVPHKAGDALRITTEVRIDLLDRLERRQCDMHPSPTPPR